MYEVSLKKFVVKYLCFSQSLLFISLREEEQKAEICERLTTKTFGNEPEREILGKETIEQSSVSSFLNIIARDKMPIRLNQNAY